MRKGQVGIVVVALIAIVAIIIFLSFTSQPGGQVTFGGAAGKGLTIEQIKYKPEVVSEETVIIEAKIKNRGNFDARNVDLEILGLTDEWKIDGETLTPGSPKRIISFPTLLGDPKFNGEEQTAIWTLTAPIKTSPITYPFTIKLTYDYSSKYEALVRVVSPTFREKGRLIDQKVTPGPISASIKSDEWRATAGFVNVELTISNVGGGEVLNGVILLSNLKNLICPQEVLRFSSKDSQFEKEVKTTCRINVGSFNDFSDVEISFNLDYRYSIKQDKSIRVKPLV